MYVNPSKQLGFNHSSHILIFSQITFQVDFKDTVISSTQTNLYTL